MTPVTQSARRNPNFFLMRFKAAGFIYRWELVGNMVFQAGRSPPEGGNHEIFISFGDVFQAPSDTFTWQCVKSSVDERDLKVVYLFAIF